MRISEMADGMVASEILRIATNIKEMITRGRKLHNLTIGDFDPQIFPLPDRIREEIERCLAAGESNYPPPHGMAELRDAVGSFTARTLGVEYDSANILISGGARPLIYATYQVLVDPGDSVIFPVPSWNNNHYVHLSRANPVTIETTPANHFMPTAEEIGPHLEGATLIALCSPQNPTGTVFSRADLEAICDLVIAENRRRDRGEKPLYVLFDQVYAQLIYSEEGHHSPVSIRPDMRDFTILIDGASKSFAATGLRVGWACGPGDVIAKMRAILTHIGAWAPRAEQIAIARFLQSDHDTDEFLGRFRERLHRRLRAFHDGFVAMKRDGYPVDAIAPQAALYLTVKIELAGETGPHGKLHGTGEVTDYLLEEAGLALIPFYAFGSSPKSSWFRLSVGTAGMSDVDGMFSKLRQALDLVAQAAGTTSTP